MGVADDELARCRMVVGSRSKIYKHDAQAGEGTARALYEVGGRTHEVRNDFGMGRLEDGCIGTQHGRVESVC